MKQRNNFLLLAILAFAFAYRFFLLTMNTFPPGADIGLHESIIKSITSGKSDFFWNNYHMGGGLSVTNPGYHIFTAFVINLTGLPDYLAQALVASFFSAFVVVAAFLMVRRVWGELEAFVVAVLATFSASDIAILCWGGYPNIVTLMLIPLAFYLFLNRSKFSFNPYLAATAIVVGAIFLTHLFSGFVFLAITALTLMVGALFSKRTELTRKNLLYWIIPIACGVLLVSPYLTQIIPFYFGSESAIGGSVASMRQAVLETRLISLGIVAACVVPALLFAVFTKYKYKGVSWFPVILCVTWIVVPAAATQSYLLGLYLDYERFLYFLALPIIICLGLVIVSLPHAFERQERRLNLKEKVKSPLNRISKRTATASLIIFLTAFTLFTPLFSVPHFTIGSQLDSIGQVNFFQIMDKPKYEAIQWIKANTPSGSICVADAEFGWWLSGFGERPTLSAVDPQYLILEREFEPAKVATNLLKANYIIDNGLLEVKQKGVFASGNTHEISSISNTSYVASPFFWINDSQISLNYRNKGGIAHLTLAQFPNSDTHVVSNYDNAAFMVERINQQLSVTEEISIYEGVSYAKVSVILQANSSDVVFDWLHLPFTIRGVSATYPNSVVIIDSMLNEFTQLIFPQGQLGNTVSFQQNQDFYELVFNLEGQSNAEVSFFVGRKQFDPNYAISQADYWSNTVENNTHTYFERLSDVPLNYFDYKAALRKWNIAYILVRDPDSIQRFTTDPTFTLAFKNSEVAIFKVVKN
ncbi:MAG: hypothetical protein NWE98_00900 [Candidatus Bathyarchaeota archaeon]|nr:hypothetical protein [Candidatus Bathyarchaeota archaeon]